MGITSSQNFNAQPERNIASFDGNVTNLDVMRRIELWTLARNMKIPFPDGATKNEMIQIIKGHEHVINALDKAAEVMEHSGDKNTPLVEQVMDVMKKAVPKEGIAEENQDDAVLRHARIWELRRECKKRGIPTKPTEKAKDLLVKLGVKVDEPSPDDNRSQQSLPETGGSDTI